MDYNSYNLVRAECLPTLSRMVCPQQLFDEAFSLSLRTQAITNPSVDFKPACIFGIAFYAALCKSSNFSLKERAHPAGNPSSAGFLVSGPGLFSTKLSTSCAVRAGLL